MGVAKTKNVLVVYNTVTGFSRTYGEWIAQDLDADLYSLAEIVDAVKTSGFDLDAYDVIVYGAGVRMSIIRGFHTFRRLLAKAGVLGKGKVIVWANGGTPQHPDRDWKAAAQTFTRKELARGEYGYYYFEGGVRYEGLNLVEEKLLRLFAKRVQNYRDRGEWAAAVADNIAAGYDHTNREAIAPLVEHAKKISLSE